jgi:serine protease Do
MARRGWTSFQTWLREKGFWGNRLWGKGGRAGASFLAAAALLLLAATPRPLRAEDPPPGFADLVLRVTPSVVNIAVTAFITDPASEPPPPPPPPAPPVPPSDKQASVSGAANGAGTMPAASAGAPGAAPEMANAMQGTPAERLFRQRMRHHHVKLVGSGFIIDSRGLIVTNNHVIDQAAALEVSLSDGTILPARVVGADDFSDIALLRVDPPHPLIPVAWGLSEKLRPGDWVVAIGNPFGLGTSVAVGVFSARGRDIGADPYDDFLQVSVPINPGNSGGPLFNAKGEVVGINTATEAPHGTSAGIGFAIPSEYALSVIEALRTARHIARGWLGVRFSGNPLAPQDDGVAIDALQPGGPAAMAGVRVGDRVLAVNGQEVDTPRDVVRAVAAEVPGSEVRLTLLRRGEIITLPVVVGRRPEIGGE